MPYTPYRLQLPSTLLGRSGLQSFLIYKLLGDGPMLKLIPNALTLARFLLAPVIAWLMWKGFSIPHFAQFGPNALSNTPEMIAEAQALGTKYQIWAAGLFVFAAFTDLFDGIAARALDAHSKFGRILDPIADKALVALPLLTFVGMTRYAQGEFEYLILIPTLVIVGRDVFITILRLLAPDGEGAPVSVLAKYKTALELIAVAMPIFMALPWIGASTLLHWSWIAILCVAALLSAITGLGYLTAKSTSQPD